MRVSVAYLSLYALLCIIGVVAKKEEQEFGKSMWHQAAQDPQLRGVLYANGPAWPALVRMGIRVNEIPYLLENVYQNFISARADNLFDSQRTQNCLRNKRVLVLGDSVLEEFVIDLGILLSGVGANEADLDAFVHTAGRNFATTYLLHLYPFCRFSPCFPS